MPCRWAIPNTSAMARSTTSRLGSGGFPIFFIVLFIKGLPFGEKNGRMGPTFLLRAFSKSPNSSSNFGPSGCANRMHKVHRLLRLSTFCRNVRAPVWSKLHTRMTVVSPVLAGQELLRNPHRAH
jgi:hypothetical protein